MHRTKSVRRGLSAAIVFAFALPVFAAAVAYALPAWAVELPDPSARRAAGLIASGEYRAAETELRQMVERLRSTPDERLVAAEANLGAALYDQGRYCEAEGWYAKALELANGVGAARAEVATIQNNIAALYRRTGRLAEAEAAAREAVRVYEMVSPDTPAVATALTTLATIETDERKYAEAESHDRRAVAILSRADGRYQAELANALVQLAKARVSERDYAGAEGLLERALETGEPLWGPRDVRLANARAALGVVRLGQRRYEDARSELEKAIAIWRSTGRDGSPEFAAALNNLAQAHKLAGERRKAEPLYKEAIASCGRWLDAGHPTCLMFAGNYADLLRSNGELRKAEDVLESSVAAARGSGRDTVEADQLRRQLSDIRAARQSSWTVPVQALRPRGN